jgi:hypothetical protein
MDDYKQYFLDLARANAGVAGAPAAWGGEYSFGGAYAPAELSPRGLAALTAAMQSDLPLLSRYLKYRAVMFDPVRSTWACELHIYVHIYKYINISVFICFTLAC